ncbi:MAG TPA: hypothetical protein VGP72_10225 [Planctomycetota bacterium]|jgi:hypothetical protein
MNKSSLHDWLVVIFVVGMVTVVSRPAWAEAEKHPHIRAAVRELAAAKKELEEADHDFGGHRAEAVKAVERAHKQLEKALEFDKGGAPDKAKSAEEPKAKANTATEAELKHPHIHAALDALRETRKDLKEAAHDFGGHRADALEATDHAIKQLKTALEYAKK